MKRLLFSLICMFIPISVMAKCDVISGDGFSGLSEVKCGDKDFHVLKNDGKTIKLLSDDLISIGVKLEDYTVDRNIYKDYLSDIVINDEYINTRLDSYKNNLINKGIDVKKVSILSFKELDEFIYQELGGYLPVEFNGDLKDFLGGRYSYVWNNNLSLRTVKNNELLMINNDGKVIENNIRFYIRPVIEVSIREIQFRVDIINNGNGLVKLDKEIYLDNEIVTLNIQPNEGYKLDSLVVYDKDDNIIPVKNNSFNMPKGDVLIKANYIEDKKEQLVLANNINKQISSNINLMIGVGVLGFILVGFLGIDYLVKNNKKELQM